MPPLLPYPGKFSIGAAGHDFDSFQRVLGIDRKRIAAALERDHAAAQSGQRGPNGLTLTLTAGKDATQTALSGVLATDKGAWEITAEPGAPLAGAQGGAFIDLPGVGDKKIIANNL